MSKRVVGISVFAVLMAIVALLILIFKHPEQRAVVVPTLVQPTSTPATSVPSEVPSVTVIDAAAVPASAPIKTNLPEGVPLVAVTFDTPQENESVPRTFQVSGHCSQVPPGQHLVLAIQTGKVFSPKWPPIQVQGDAWSGRAMEYGVRSGGSFTLCVFEVTDAGLEEISLWDAEGVKTRRWPPFREIPGGTLLNSIKLRVAAQP